MFKKYWATYIEETVTRLHGLQFGRVIFVTFSSDSCGLCGGSVNTYRSKSLDYVYACSTIRLYSTPLKSVRALEIIMQKGSCINIGQPFAILCDPYSDSHVVPTSF